MEYLPLTRHVEYMYQTPPLIHEAYAWEVDASCHSADTSHRIHVVVGSIRLSTAPQAGVRTTVSPQ